MKKLSWFAILGFVLMSQVGCYTTKVSSTPTPPSPTYDDRQWFTLGGFVPLSGPAGRECPNGFNYVESKLGAVDILINVGLAVGGGLVGGLACANNPDVMVRAQCASAFTTLVPFLLGTRTVSYSCNAGGGGAVSQSVAVEQPVTPASTPALPADAPVAGPR